MEGVPGSSTLLDFPGLVGWLRRDQGQSICGGFLELLSGEEIRAKLQKEGAAWLCPGSCTVLQ